MKKLIIIILFFLPSISNGQVDSFYWDHTVSPHTFYNRILVGYGNQIKHIDQYFQVDTLFIDMIFTDCAGPTSGYIWDSLISIPSSISTPQYHFVVRLVLDSNTIVNNCYIHPRWHDTIFTYFIPVGVNDYDRDKLKALRPIPNPVVSKLQLDGIEGPDLMVGIYSCTGLLISRNLYGQFIDVSQLIPGLYFLRVENAAGYKPGWFRKE